MRTTLELDDDLVNTAKDLARQQGSTLGRVISDLALQSLAAQAPPKYRNGFAFWYRVPALPGQILN